MLKRLLSLMVVFSMAFTLVGCDDATDNGSDDANNETNSGTNNVERPFTESEGEIRYFTVDGIKMAIPETVGEYQRYLEQVGTKVELYSNPSSDETIDLDETLEAGAQSSLRAYFRVYVDGENYHKFGVHYVNNTEDDGTVENAKVDRMILYYDTDIEVQSSQPELSVIDTITLETDTMTFYLDYSTTKRTDIWDIAGGPSQNTDGYLTFNDPSGFVYKMSTSNQLGVLSQVEILYPEQ